MIPVPPEVLDQFMGQVFPGAINPTPIKRAGRDYEMTIAVLYLIKSEFSNGTIVRLDGGHNLVNP
jgi:hypothetical protein